MRDSESQRSVQHHKSLKVPRNATNRNKHINEASKQTFANNLFKISCKYTQGMLSNCKICFNIINKRIDDENLCKFMKIRIPQCKRPVLTSQFDVSKLQKHFKSVIQIHLD